MKVSGSKRHGRKGIGTVLATIIFVFIVIFMTANLIVWGIVQSADLQSVINQMTQRDQQQASERTSIPTALFGGTNKYVSCVVGTGSSCANPTLASAAGQAVTPLIANQNYTSNTNGWVFTKILAPGTSSGITGGYDAGGTEIGAVGSPSGPGMVYMGVSFFPPSGTATYSATWSSRFFLSLSQFGITGSQGFDTARKCSGPNCQIIGSWAWILPRVNPGVISMTVKLEVADSQASGTACTPPHCFGIDSQTYTTLADQTWNYRKATWGGVSTTGVVSSASSTSLVAGGSPGWTADQWDKYSVSITSGTGAGQSRNVTLTTAPNTLTVFPAWTVNPDATSSFTISLTASGTSSSNCSAPCTTVTDTSQNWYVNEWQGAYVSITGGTGTGQTAVVASNTASALTLNSAWVTPPDTTSQYVIGCPSNTFCDWDIRTSALLNQIPTTFTQAFWGTAANPGFYTVQVESDFTLSQSANPSEVRVMFDDVGLEFTTPSSFASSGGSSSGTIIDLPFTNGENTGLVQQLTISTATSFDASNIQEASYIKDYTTGIFVPLASGLVSQQTVNTTNTFTGADTQKYIGTLTARNLLNQPASVAFDSALPPNLWVSDQHNNRIVEYANAVLGSNGPDAAIVIGQSSFTASASATSATGLSNPSGIAFDSSGNLWVADTGNNRVLEFLKGAGFTTGESASIVIGQTSFTTSSATTSASSLTSPSDIAFDSSGNLWVADTGNNRVLEFLKGAGFTTGESATTVLGQSSFTVSSPSPDSGTATGTQSSTTLQDTSKTWSANQWVNGIVSIVSGTGVGQSRTVVSNTGNTLTVSPAWVTTPVAGVSSYSISPSTTTVANLNAPIRLEFDASGNVWVVDGGNNRVLEFTTPFSNGKSASLVLGQSSFTTSGSATSATGFSGPVGLIFDSSGNLWVADTGNNRVLEFTTPFSNGKSASLVLGQSSLTTNTGATTQSGLSAPNGDVFDSSGNIWVTDKTNYRVVKFLKGAGFTTGESATTVLGQSSFTLAAHPNVELRISATNPTAFHVKTMAASVQDFFKDPNHVSVQVSNGWASTSHLVDVFITDSSGTHCFTRVPTACGAQYVSSSAAASGTTLTDSTGTQGTWTLNQYQSYFAFITSGTGAGSYGTITGNSIPSGSTTTLTVGSWTGTAPSGTVGYFIGLTWAGLYVAPGSTGIVQLQYTWANGPVTIKVTTDLGNTVVLNTIAG